MFDNLAVRALGYLMASVFGALAVYNAIMAMTLNESTAIAGAIVTFIIILTIAIIYLNYLVKRRDADEQIFYQSDGYQQPSHHEPQIQTLAYETAQPPKRYCSTCQYPLRYVPEYNNFYCDVCSKYDNEIV
jgi:hypothetical protein